MPAFFFYELLDKLVLPQRHTKIFTEIHKEFKQCASNSKFTKLYLKKNFAKLCETLRKPLCISVVELYTKQGSLKLILQSFME